ncbi:MAG: Fe-S metabolism protein SufE [Halobacteriovoraceae bacterium]|nr:Fe-S metabolism protein SufE [Halobacteriovoraceae bacterium]MBC98261.1 Fe-S metabolism protein SufE [Halobacteriovoraceae bacterium]|tara:strand:- start:1700 stop:2149 length:450 start_codon:yes stop_codon:yes gene_type:complete
MVNQNNHQDPRVAEVIASFSQFSDWESRYKHLIGMGKELDSFPEEHRTEENKVKGCQSQVWLYSELKEGKVIFFGDSDASIVKGIVALLLKIYSNREPAEIMSLQQDFVDAIGLKQHLSMSRANGLSAMMKQIQFYALAYKTKIDLGMK